MTVTLDAGDARDLVESDDLKDLITEFEDSGLGLIYGVEEDGRTCPSFSLGEETVVLIFSPEERTVVGRDSYNPGRTYMLVDDPAIDGVCQYIAMMTPSPSPVPVTPTEDPSAPTDEPAGPTESVAPTTTDDPTTGGGAGVGGGSTGDGSDGEDGSGDSSGEPSPDGDAEPSVSPDDDSVCFPADAEVEMEDGSVKMMSAVEIGDRVKVAEGVFSDVYMFTHKLANVVNDFVKLDTSSGASIEATAGHYLYINGRFAAAVTAKTGDMLELANGARTVINKVSTVSKTGLYNPQTVHGDIVVNSIRASTFTRVIEPKTAQALLAPLRMVYGKLGWSTSMFDQGANIIASVLPKGQMAL